jgi:F-type H+-transporting ATPase subunit gamma
MGNLKEIRTRISSVISTRQITSAMKMVSASKLRRAQDAIIQMRPYANKLQEIQTDLSNNYDEGEPNIYLPHREIKRVLLIAITSNKGLCGAFNANVGKKIILLIEEEYKNLYQYGQLDIICIGKKGSEFLKSKGFNITENHHDIFDHLSFEAIVPLVNKIISSFATGIYDEIKIVYNQFRNAAVQDLVSEHYLPIVSLTEKEELKKENHFDFILEPSRDYIINELIPKSLKIQLFKALLESHASEHGARMTAMHKATDNASEMIKQLQLDYNKARQASITKEILEIVGGAEALKK